MAGATAGAGATRAYDPQRAHKQLVVDIAATLLGQNLTTAASIARVHNALIAEEQKRRRHAGAEYAYGGLQMAVTLVTFVGACMDSGTREEGVREQAISVAKLLRRPARERSRLAAAVRRLAQSDMRRAQDAEQRGQPWARRGPGRSRERYRAAARAGPARARARRAGAVPPPPAAAAPHKPAARPLRLCEGSLTDLGDTAVRPGGGRSSTDARDTARSRGPPEPPAVRPMGREGAGAGAPGARVAIDDGRRPRRRVSPVGPVPEAGGGRAWLLATRAETRTATATGARAPPLRLPRASLVTAMATTLRPTRRWRTTTPTRTEPKTL